MNRVLVFAVHPDDETLGCGGTLLKHKSKGDEIFWLIGTSIKEGQGFTKKDVLQQERQIETVKEMYGFSSVTKLDVPTMKVDEFPVYQLTENISACFNAIKPNIIYFPFMHDAHSDHRVFFNAAHSCTKIFRYPFIKNFFMMETISETEFVPGVNGSIFLPNYFVDISDFLEKKIDIMKVFESELRHHPFPRSLKNIRALATFRGAMAGCNYAESFMVLKEIW